MDHTITMPRTAGMVAAVRVFAGQLLAELPVAEDAQTAAAALAAAAVAYGADERMTVRVRVEDERRRVRVSVSTVGAPLLDALQAAAEGRADTYAWVVAVILAVAVAMGHERNADGSTLWADLTWDADGGEPQC